MKLWKVAPAAIAAGTMAFASLPARADGLTALEILQQFNAVISNNFTSTADVEGRLVANTIVGGATFYNNPNPLSAPSAFAAVSAERITGCNWCNIDNGGGVDYVTSDSGSFNFNGSTRGSAVQDSPAFTMSEFTQPMNALVTELTGLSANSTINASNTNDVTFDVTPDADGIAVFTVSDAELASYAGVSFSNVTSAKTIVIDVTGSSFAQNFNYVDTAANILYENEHVIWNFEDASSVSIKTIHGAVLAEDATVTNNSPIEGMLYAENYVGNGELHNYPFEGVLPGAAAAPEPSTWAMMGLGFLGLAFLGRRASRKAATVRA
jgi:choice-of-anchor A domain-containing protein